MVRVMQQFDHPKDILFKTIAAEQLRIFDYKIKWNGRDDMYMYKGMYKQVQGHDMIRYDTIRYDINDEWWMISWKWLPSGFRNDATVLVKVQLLRNQADPVELQGTVPVQGCLVGVRTLHCIARTYSWKRTLTRTEQCSTVQYSTVQ